VIRAVLDTGALISAFINRHGPSRHIFEAWQESKLELVTSLPLLQELDGALHHDRIQLKYALGEDDVYAYILLLGTQGTVVRMPRGMSTLSGDLADNEFLACALAGRAQFIITGDDELLELGRFAGIRLITPRDFVIEILGSWQPMLPGLS
jgi:putative PIN family toxin of toxin-antitoxin system